MFSLSSRVPLLPTHQPPRPVRTLPFRTAVAQTLDLTSDLQHLVRLWQRWGRDWWTELDAWATVRARKGADAVPYVRSLQQVASSLSMFRVEGRRVRPESGGVLDPGEKPKTETSS